MPPTHSRRRACTACNQAKRRCDQQLPRCGRCQQRGLAVCSYEFPRSEAQRDTEDAIGGADVPAYHDVAPPIPYFADILPASEPVGIAGHGASAFQEFVNGLNMRAADNSNASSSTEIPVVSDYGDNPWPIFFNASGPANTSISRASMAYCVKEYRTWPRSWVVETATPFIHQSLYAVSGALARTGGIAGGGGITGALGISSTSLSGLPPALQDAFAVSAAYAAKNDANSDLVMQLVETKAAALMYSPGQGNWTIMEQLASLQALLVYQMVRLFDGDIRQRALGEATEPVQAAWTAALQARVGAEIFQNADLTPSDDPAAAWRRWLFNESVRRTIITSFMIRGIYAMAKQGYCRLGAVVTDMSFTSGMRLWAAKTPGRWQRAVGEANPGWISHMNFSDMLGRADPANVDSLGIMMAVTYKGKDVIEDWMAREL